MSVIPGWWQREAKTGRWEGIMVTLAAFLHGFKITSIPMQITIPLMARLRAFSDGHIPSERTSPALSLSRALCPSQVL